MTWPTTAPSIPLFGTLAEAEALIAEALELGIRTIVDIVPNHVSDQHPWFQAALAAGPGSPERERFWFRPGRGADGASHAHRLALNFSGTTWTRTTRPRRHARRVVPAPVRGRAAGPQLGPPRRARRARGHPAVLVRPRRGGRPHRLGRAARQGPGPARGARRPPGPGEHPTRTATSCTTSTAAGAPIADSLPGPRVLVGEVWLPDVERFTRYLRPDELHTAFNFDFLARPWDAGELRASIDAHARGACAGRRAGDLGAVQPRRDPAGDPLRPGGQLVRVRRQAPRRAHRPRARPPAGPGGRAARGRAARLALHLPGRRARPGRGRRPAPRAASQDPMYHRSGGEDPGRDGCRVPLPWSGEHGRRSASARPGRGGDLAPPARPLGGPDRRGPAADPARCSSSTGRAAPPARRARPRRRPAGLAARTPTASSRSPAATRFVSITNLSDGPVAAARRTPSSLLASAPLTDGRLPVDATAWLRPEPPTDSGRGRG